ncbi:hypothetical protein AB1E18_015444 [Capra hircus]
MRDRSQLCQQDGSAFQKGLTQEESTNPHPMAIQLPTPREFPWGARVSHCGAFSCGAGTRGRRQAQQLRCTGSAALRHVGSSRSGDQIHAPCVGRQTLNQPTTGESLASLAAELGSLGAGFSTSAR